MNENTKKWVEALRSGKYKQTEHVLQDTNGYCCLGVACVVYEQETGITLQRSEVSKYLLGSDLSGRREGVKELRTGLA
jgi:hypothetical protein